MGFSKLPTHKGTCCRESCTHLLSLNRGKSKFSLLLKIIITTSLINLISEHHLGMQFVQRYHERQKITIKDLLSPREGGGGGYFLDFVHKNLYEL